MEQRLVTATECRPDALSFRGTVPVGGSGDCAGMGGETHKNRVLSVPLAHELTDIQFSGCPHLCSPSISKMRVVRPKCDLGRSLPEMIDERIESFDHVLVAQIPGPNLTFKHRAIVTLGVCHQSRILLGDEESVGIQMAVAVGEVRRSLLHFYELVDHFVFATLAQAEPGGVSVSLSILTKMFKARVSIAGSLGCLRIDLVQEVEYCSSRSMQAVEVKAVKANFPAALW